MGSRAVDSGRRTASGQPIYVPRRDRNKKKQETTTFQGRTVSVIRSDLDVGGGSPAVAPQPTSSDGSGSSRSTSTSQPQPTQESIQEEQRRDTVVDSGRRTSTGQPIYISPQQALREQATKPQIQPLGTPSQQMQQTRREMPAPYSPQQQQSILTTQWKKEQEEKTERAVAASKEAQLYSGIAVESLRGMGYSPAETVNVLRGQTAITEEQYKSIEPTITRATSAGVTATTLATDKQRLAYESGAVKDVPAPTFVPPPTRTETIKQNIADWNTVVKESKVYKPISTSLSQSADFFRERAQDRRALFDVRSQDAIALRYTMDDDSLKAKAFDVGYKISSSVIDFQSKRDSAVAGFSQFFADKPVTAGLIATTGAGVAAGGAIVGGAVGAGMLAVGVKPAIVTASGVATSKAIVGSGLTLFTAGTLAGGAQIRDPDVRFEFYGEQAGKLAVAVAGAQTFKMTDVGIKSFFTKSTSEVSGVKFESRRIDIGKKVVDVTRSESEIVIKPKVGSPQTFKVKSIGTEKFTQQPQADTYFSKGIQKSVISDVSGKQISQVSVKSVGTTKITSDTAKSVRFMKLDDGKGLQRNILASSDKFTTQDGLMKVKGVYETVAGRTSFKTAQVGTTASQQEFSMVRTFPSGEQGTYSVYRGASIGVKDANYFKGLKFNVEGVKLKGKLPTDVPSKISSKLQTTTQQQMKPPVSSLQTVSVAKQIAGMVGATKLASISLPATTSVAVGVTASALATTQQQQQKQKIQVGTLPATSSRIDVLSKQLGRSATQFDVRQDSRLDLKTSSLFDTRVATQQDVTPMTTTSTKSKLLFNLTPFSSSVPSSFTPNPFMLPPVPFKLPGGNRFTSNLKSLFKKGDQEKAYKPTLRAVGLGLTKKGKKKPKGMLTGLEERY